MLWNRYEVKRMRRINADTEEARMRGTNAVQDWYRVGFRGFQEMQAVIGLFE
jgi:hypothetical protein